MKMDNPFKNNLPSKKLVSKLPEKKSCIESKNPAEFDCQQSSCHQRTNQGIASSLRLPQRKQFHEILEQPERVFNGEKTGSFLNSKGSNVLSRKIDKNIQLMSTIKYFLILNSSFITLILYNKSISTIRKKCYFLSRDCLKKFLTRQLLGVLPQHRKQNQNYFIARQVESLKNVKFLLTLISLILRSLVKSIR